MFHILRIHQEDLAAPRLSPDSALLYRGYAPSLCSSERCLYLLYAARERGLPPTASAVECLPANKFAGCGILRGNIRLRPTEIPLFN